MDCTNSSQSQLELRDDGWSGEGIKAAEEKGRKPQGAGMSGKSYPGISSAQGNLSRHVPFHYSASFPYDALTGISFFSVDDGLMKKQATQIQKQCLFYEDKIKTSLNNSNQKQKLLKSINYTFTSMSSPPHVKVVPSTKA